MDDITRRKILAYLAQQGELPGNAFHGEKQDYTGLPPELMDLLLQSSMLNQQEPGGYYPAFGNDQEGADRARRMAKEIQIPEKDDKFQSLIRAIQPNSTPKTREEIIKLFPEEMRGILRQESSDGKNTKHARTSQGQAAGFSGLMPNTARDAVNSYKIPEYQQFNKMSNDQITQYLNQHPEAEAKIASAHWDHISNKFEDPNQRKFAWNQGITNALRADPENVANHWYVQGVNQKEDEVKREQDETKETSENTDEKPIYASR